MGATHAVLIGIETYQKQGISSVQFAQADAAAMKDVLVQDLGVPAENITVWLDSEATKSVFENDLPYLIRQLLPGIDSSSSMPVTDSSPMEQTV